LATDRQTDRLTDNLADGQTDGLLRCTKPLSRLNKPKATSLEIV